MCMSSRKSAVCTLLTLSHLLFLLYLFSFKSPFKSTLLPVSTSNPSLFPSLNSHFSSPRPSPFNVSQPKTQETGHMQHPPLCMFHNMHTFYNLPISLATYLSYLAYEHVNVRTQTKRDNLRQHASSSSYQ